MHKITRDCDARAQACVAGGRAGRWALVTTWLCLPALLAGCASQGTLKPPSLHLPGPVTGLAAERFGDRVQLKWVTPERTTDGELLTAGKLAKKPLTAEVCRQQDAPAACVVVARVAAVAGAAGSFDDRLYGALTQGAARPLKYEVRVLNAAGRAARERAVTVAAGEAPAAMDGLQAKAVRGGVELQWKPEPLVAGDRILLRVERVAGAAASGVGAAATGVDKGALMALPLATRDPGGALDGNAKTGVRDSYKVYRARVVTDGGQTLTLNGAVAEVAITPVLTVFPPERPNSLAAVASTLGAPEIDLIWQPNVELDVVGYLVYRAEGDGAAQQLTPMPVKAFTYADTTVKVGVAYNYFVVAVDAYGNRSGESAPVVERVLQP